MPTPLMHIQGALRLLRDQRLPEPLAAAVTAQPWAYRLGAFLVDLPLFDRFPLKVALFLIHRPYPESRWGSAIHARGCGGLATALLRRAPEEPREPLYALVAGMLTHLALDRVMHEPIERAVNQHLRPTETHSQLHEALENYQSLVWHRAHLGCDGIRTPWLDYLSVAPTGERTLPPWLSRVFRDSLAQVYGLAPAPAEVDRWTTGICGYRDLLNSPLGKISIRSSERLVRQRPWVAEIELQPAFERGLDLGERYLAAAGRWLGEDTFDLAREIGDGPLV